MSEPAQVVEEYLIAFNEQDIPALSELFESISDDFIEGSKAWWSAFPDLKLTKNRMVANESHAVLHFTFRGTHEGEFKGFAPTGKNVEVTEMMMFSVEDGKITDRWVEWDELGFYQQLGIIDHPTK